jgi:hypothetical protein
LRAVAHGWRQEALAKNAQEVAELGKELYGRIAKLGEHWMSVGDRLGKAVDAYNSATATLETRVLVSARRFRELKAAAEGVEIEMPGQIERVPRQVQGVEMVAANDAGSDGREAKSEKRRARSEEREAKSEKRRGDVSERRIDISDDLVLRRVRTAYRRQRPLPVAACAL